jgi:hypothetical protein
MTRRKFLGLTLVTVAAISAGSFQLFNSDDRFNLFIKKSLPWLNFDPDVVGKFKKDYFQYQCKSLSSQFKFSIFLVLETTPLFDKILLKKRDFSREPLLTQFLLSSDFFKNGMREDRVIKYYLYYDPYINPCNNPKS